MIIFGLNFNQKKILRWVAVGCSLRSLGRIGRSQGREEADFFDEETVKGRFHLKENVR
jgi:hypothetical protein